MNTTLFQTQQAKNIDLLLKLIVLFLMSLGIVMIFSAQSRVNSPIEFNRFFFTPAGKQIIFTIIAMTLILTISKLNYTVFQSIHHILLIIALILVVSVYTPIGVEINGARRWIRIGSFTFQPSEFLKFALVIFLAGKLTRKNFNIKSFWKGLIPIAIISGICCAIVGKEDFGTALLLACIVGLMLIIGGAKISHLIILSIPAIVGFSYLIITNPYRLNRIISFLDIWSDPQNKGYHAIQSLIGIANGGWFGVGLGNGLQKYGYLPEDTTDFIFSIICEELGFIGAAIVILLIISIIVISLWIYKNTSNTFGKLLTFGFVSTIGLQTCINIAVVTVSIPTKGIALPFISAGGSGLICFSLSVAILCNILSQTDSKAP